MMTRRAPHRLSSDANAWGPPEWVRAFVLAAVTGVGMYVCYLLTVPFVSALAWALALAVLFAPVHRWIEARLKKPNVAASVSVLMVVFIVGMPATFVAGRLIEEAANGANAIRSNVESGTWRRAIEAHPRIAPLGRWIAQQFDLPAAMSSAVSWLANTSASFVRVSVTQVIGLLLTLYFLFYFLRDRRAAVGSLADLLPLSAAETDRLSSRAIDTIHATMYGTLVCAVVQGTLSGLMFWWLDLPAPLLWGVVMGLLAVVPVFGAFIVWIPAAVFLALDGSWGRALILTAWGTLVVGLIDNLLYPMLVGNRLKLHSILSFVSVVGGLIVFGASGLILGPLAVTITLALLETWRTRISTNPGDSSEP